MQLTTLSTKSSHYNNQRTKPTTISNLTPSQLKASDHSLLANHLQVTWWTTTDPTNPKSTIGSTRTRKIDRIINTQPALLRILMVCLPHSWVYPSLLSTQGNSQESDHSTRLNRSLHLLFSFRMANRVWTRITSIISFLWARTSAGTHCTPMTWRARMMSTRRSHPFLMISRTITSEEGTWTKLSSCKSSNNRSINFNNNSRSYRRSSSNSSFSLTSRWISHLGCRGTPNQCSNNNLCSVLRWKAIKPSSRLSHLPLRHPRRITRAHRIHLSSHKAAVRLPSRRVHSSTSKTTISNQIISSFILTC